VGSPLIGNKVCVVPHIYLTLIYGIRSILHGPAEFEV
jgi:hypothetical protein